MSQDAREQARHISEVTKAYAEGKEIQFRFNSRSEIRDEKWHDCESAPMWLFGNYDYRVKPEERKPREWSLTMFGGEVIGGMGPTLKEGEIVRVREVLPETETE